MLVKNSLLNHRPNYLITGPHLPIPNKSDRDKFPIEITDIQGVFFENHDQKDRDTFFESIFRRAFWRTPSTALLLRKGKYKIIIWSPKKTLGEFILAFGVEEDFSDFSFSQMIKNWSTYAY